MSYLELRLEESPRYEGALTTTPYRISTVAKFLPVQSAVVRPEPQHIDRSDEARNIEGSVSRMLDQFRPTGNITCRAYPNILPYLLLANGWQDVITPGGPAVMDPDATVAPVGTTRHVLTKRGGLTAKTFQLIFGYTEVPLYIKGQGFGVNNLTMNAAGDLSADLTGLVTSKIADPTLSPVLDSAAIPHFRRADMILTWLTGSGETDDFTLAIGNPLEQRDSMGTTFRSYFPDKLFHGNERVAVTGSIPKYTLDPEDWDSLISASTFLGKVAWKSDYVIGATGYTYKMWLEMPACQIIGGGPEELGNRRRYGMTLDWFAAWDQGGANYDAKITIVNSETVLETLV